MADLTRLERMVKANDLLRLIGDRGERFFHDDGKYSRFELDLDGCCWFWDCVIQKLIYTHYNGKWKDFSEGSALKIFIRSLRDYIMKGQKLPTGLLGPWALWDCGGDPWGYGSAMEEIRTFARVSGILL